MVSSYLVVVSAASQVLLLVVVLTSRKAAARCGTPRVCEACRDGEALGDLHEGQEKECKIAVPGKYQQINLKEFHHQSLVTHRSGRKIVPSARRVCLSRRVCQSGGGWGSVMKWLHKNDRNAGCSHSRVFVGTMNDDSSSED